MLLPVPFLQQLLVEEIAVGPAFRVKPGARIAAPIPSTADVGAGLEHAKVHPELAQTICDVHTGNAAADDYKDANIDIAAISFHSAVDVRASMNKMGDQGFPFRLLADPKMRTWYEWLTVDAHDHAPLHGTFLVDEQGRVRWKQIADHPFEDPEWLLAEAKRLLGRKVAGSVR